MSRKRTYLKAAKNGMFITGTVLFLTVLLVAVFADRIAPHKYDEMNIEKAFIPPGRAYLFGTDEFGRCLFSRIIYGSRIALKIGLMVVAIQISVGVSVGLLAGYFGGKLDMILSFITDLTWAMPPVVLSLAIVTVLGPSLERVVISTALVSWPGCARMVRSKTQSIKNMPFVEAARALGESDLSIIIRYILPNTLGIVIVLTTLQLPGAILSTTGLSFLGLGSQPPSPDWGLILSEGVNYVSKAPWISIFPGLALIYTTVGFNLMGEGLRDILDPRT